VRLRAPSWLGKDAKTVFAAVVPQLVEARIARRVQSIGEVRQQAAEAKECVDALEERVVLQLLDINPQVGADVGLTEGPRASARQGDLIGAPPEDWFVYLKCTVWLQPEVGTYYDAAD